MSLPSAPTPDASMRPEVSLILACARTHVDAPHAERIRTLASANIDWAWLLQMSIRHRTLPLLYRNLATHSRDVVPQSTLAALGRHFKANALRNLVLTKRLVQLLRALDANGVSAIPYKGPALAEFAYGDLSLRQFADLDVLVRPRDLSKAAGTLVSLGYRLVTEPGIPQEAYLQSMHHYNFAHDDIDATVELHWRATERYFASSSITERCWRRTKPATLAGAAVHYLAGEDLLLLLCIHSAKHGWECLAQVCDVAELVRKHAAELDWQRLASEARSLGFQRTLLLGLSLATDWLGAPLPEGIAQKIQADPALPPLTSQIQTSLFQENHASTHPAESERLRFFRLHLKMRERFRDKVAYCLRVVLIPSQEDWEFIALPPRLSFLYYGLRPVRLLGKYVRKALARPRH